MYACSTILFIIIIYQLFRLSNKAGYMDYPIGRPGNIPTAPRHRIDSEFGIRVPMFSIKSAVHPITARKLIVSRNWDDANRHLIEYKLGKTD